MSSTIQRCPFRIAALALLMMASTLPGCRGNVALQPDEPAHPPVGAPPTQVPPPAGVGLVANDSKLRSWWHDNGERNDSTPVADGKVRQSTEYEVMLSTVSSPGRSYRSFVYMSIPRSGRGKQGYTEEDGADFAASAQLSMSWSSFLYSADTWVEVKLTNSGTIASADDVVIRPTTLNFQKQMVDHKTVRIKVPYSPDGYRFSVEFPSEQTTVYNDMSGISGQPTTTAGGGNREIHTEPRNAMLVFAAPMLAGGDADRLVPNPDLDSIHYVPPGEVRNLDSIQQQVVYFAPGTYYMPWNYHARLPPNVRWVYLAPGAYVKGAFQFPAGQASFKVSGFGVLSGEKYVYEPDVDNGYLHSTAPDCHGSCVKMLRFESGNHPQHLDLHGITVSEPPYHSFVVYGYEDQFAMTVEQYKQVGGWYWQTDGIELYKGSTLRNVFFHANDDVLKLYHSNVEASNVQVWKSENGPVIQWGWVPRNIENVHVDGVDIIHNRIYWKDVKYNTCIINSSTHYADMGSTTTADPGTLVKDLLLENIRSEGMNNCAMRLHALSNWENIHIRNLAIEAWNGLDAYSQQSRFQAFTNSAGVAVTIGNETSQHNGLAIESYTVGGTLISKAGNNWSSNDLGRLNFDGALWENWDAR